MINLITGTPGSGKTSYALKFMLEQIKGSKRKIYVHGIPNLKIPHEQVYCRSKTCDHCSLLDIENMPASLMADQWHEHAPDGSIYFFDEVQNIYRPRSSASKVPESVASFEVHRHRGLDFFLITQNPRLLDSNIRALVSRHIHLKPTWAGRFQYEWAECKDSIQSTSDAIKSKYTLDKKTFDLYKSASIHTKQKRKIPVQVFIILASFTAIPLISYRVYARLNPEMANPNEQNKSNPSSEYDGDETRRSRSGTSPSDDSEPNNYYSVNELAAVSYEKNYDENKISSDSCFTLNEKTYKCFIPKNLARRFKQNYCLDDLCYALIAKSDGFQVIENKGEGV